MKLISYKTGRCEDLKEEYHPKSDNDPIPTYAIEIRLDNKHKILHAKVKSLKQSWDDMWKNTPFKKISKKAQDKIDDPNYVIDTSNWVKPDEESIRHELLGCLLYEEMLIEGTEEYYKNNAEKHVYYSLLHSTSPKNPQSITNFAMHDNVYLIYSELKNKGACKEYSYWLNRTGRKRVKYDHDKAIEHRKTFLKTNLAKMVKVF